MAALAAAHGLESRRVGLVLQNPLAGELARLDLLEDLLHFLTRFISHNSNNVNSDSHLLWHRPAASGFSLCSGFFSVFISYFA